MAWALIDDNFPNHPKAVQAGPVAAYLFVCGLCYCRRYHTGGFIPANALKTLGVSTNPRRLVDALIKAGLWDSADGGVRVHDYEDIYADDTDKAAKESRRANGRIGGKSKKVGIEHSVLNLSLPSPDGTGTGSEEVIDQERENEGDGFDAFWFTYPRKDGKQAAREVWRRLRPDAATRARIARDVQLRSRSPQWLKDAGQFCPHARTYLNQRRWEDGFGIAPEREPCPLCQDSGFSINPETGLRRRCPCLVAESA